MPVQTEITAKTSVKQRILYIDILRTLAILAVIMLHCISGYFVNAELYGTNSWRAVNILNTFTRTGVPLFFMISGYLLISDEKDTTLRSYFKRRLPKILIPFFIWNAAYYVYYSVQNGADMNLGSFLYRFVTMDISYHFWFVYTLLSLYLVVPIIKPFLRRATNTQLLYALLVAAFPTTIGPLINKLSGVWLFRFEPVFLGYVGFFILGYILGRTSFSFRSRTLIYIAGICSALLSIFGTEALSYSELIDTFFNSGYGISPYCLSSAVFVFVKQLSENITSAGISRTFSTLGTLSYGVYLSHVMVMNIIYDIFAFKHVYESVILGFILTAVICFALTFLISKIKWLRNTLI